MNNKTGRPILIILIAVAIIAGVSLLPLAEWSGGKLKNFSLVSDVQKVVAEDAPADSTEVTDDIDPELLEAMAAEVGDAVVNGTPAPHPLTAPDSVLAQSIDTIISEPKPSRSGDLVVIEDYSASGLGLVQLRNAINTGRLARIAVVGDSYIEGDIFTQDFRELMQSAYGGEGVGFVNMHSDFPGFRRSVKQGGKGWKTYLANKKDARRDYIDLAEQYAMPTGEATSTYQGTKAFTHTGSWAVSRMLFIAPEGAEISVKAGQSDWQTHNIEASPDVKCIEVASATSDFQVKTSTRSLIGLGVWLDGLSGVSVDCMSSRGFSGITLTKVNPELCRQMSTDVDYNLIILEFGINALSASQSNYSLYCTRMVEVINHVRRCYPRADILLMGIGDRGMKRGGAVVSMPTAAAMVSAQRDAARRAHCLFWDTREAMGGDGAVVEWCRSGLVNKDYIHMTHKGGARLAKALFAAVQASLNHTSPAPAFGADTAEGSPFQAL